VASFFPWWIIAVVAFAVALLLPQKAGRAFLSGFLGIFLFWLCCSLYADIANQHILSARMATLFHLPAYGLFLVVAAMVGGLVGGFAAWGGAALRQ
jgi:hypothetical protein